MSSIIVNTVSADLNHEETIHHIANALDTLDKVSTYNEFFTLHDTLVFQKYINKHYHCYESLCIIGHKSFVRTSTK